MSEAKEDLAVRLYGRLIEAADARSPEAGALTVGEIYQELIPYRSVRGELGVFELAAYEHALLRLLSGENGLLHVVDPAARSEMAAELGSPNPILGIYRDYAAREVMLAADPAATPAPARETGAPSESAPTESAPTESAPIEHGPIDDLPLVRPDRQAAPSVSPRHDGLPAPTPLPADATRVALPASGRPPRPASPAADRAACLRCDRPLPVIDGLRFCPHCGADQSELPCARCSTPLQLDWNFCIRCGAERPAS